MFTAQLLTGVHLYSTVTNKVSSLWHSHQQGFICTEQSPRVIHLYGTVTTRG